ncbi:MAG: hemerythrin [Desulfobulbaceae bacterium]|nr:MAG: hemerythrin [Desulfobulbaceae bacterium]
MSFFTWKDEYSVGIREIDDQHKKLVAMINELHQALANGKGRDVLGNILQQLIDYTGYHFSSEERLMEKYDYPDYVDHKQIHARLTDKVLELQKEFESSDVKRSIEVARFLQDWLNKHILQTDKAFGPFLTKKGVS